jgi:hypothetical protein
VAARPVWRRGVWVSYRVWRRAERAGRGGAGSDALRALLSTRATPADVPRVWWRGGWQAGEPEDPVMRRKETHDRGAFERRDGGVRT